MNDLTREEGFSVFREGSGGDGSFHATPEAAEEEARRLAGELAALVVPAVRFTSGQIEGRRAEEARAERAAARHRRESARGGAKD